MISQSMNLNLCFAIKANAGQLSEYRVSDYAPDLDHSSLGLRNTQIGSNQTCSTKYSGELLKNTIQSDAESLRSPSFLIPIECDQSVIVL